MEKFKPFELLIWRIRPRVAEEESTFESTTHKPTRAAWAKSVHLFKWKAAFKAAFKAAYFLSGLFLKRPIS